ncbi:MAG: hypothetical protein R2813_09400 [Flavobacteriales bacterium]
MKIREKHSIGVFFFYLILAYPVFYFSYKFGSPEISGQADYFAYYKLYKTLSIEGVDAPTNMRLISSFLVYLIYQSGFYYPVEIVFSDPAYDQAVYFSSVFVSFVSAAVTSTIIYNVVLSYSKNHMAGIISGCLYFLQYGTVIWGSGGLADGFSTMLFALLLYTYLKRSLTLFVCLLPLAVFQREIILMAFATFFFLEFGLRLYEHVWAKRALGLLVYTLGLFAIYVYLRETVFFTPRYSGYTSSTFYQDLFDFSPASILKYLRGTILSQNLLWLYLGLIFYSLKKKIPFDKQWSFYIIGFFVVINVVCFLLKAPSEAGRYFYVTSPLLICGLGLQGHQLLSTNNEVSRSITV